MSFKWQRWLMPPQLDRLALVVTVLYVAIVTWLLLAPIPNVPQVAGGDKLHHALAFAALVLPCAVARPRAAIPIALGAIAYGGAMELIQPSFGRSAEWLDLLADAVGAVLGVLLGRWLRPRLDAVARAPVQGN